MWIGILLNLLRNVVILSYFLNKIVNFSMAKKFLSSTSQQSDGMYHIRPILLVYGVCVCVCVFNVESHLATHAHKSMVATFLFKNAFFWLELLYPKQYIKRKMMWQPYFFSHFNIFSNLVIVICGRKNSIKFVKILNGERTMN